jgi:hypothetical protein
MLSIRSKRASKTLLRVAPATAIAVAALVAPSSALAQATRTWVSGVGDDANPCSRTAPCKTFAGAISKTATNGEINALDPGGFGGVTITKSITIAAEGVNAGVLVAGTNGIVINAGTSDKVTLRGLDINGSGNGLDAVKILQAGSVRVENSRIFGFAHSGIFLDTAGSTGLVVDNTTIHDNGGNGVMVAPPPRGVGAATVRDSRIDHNACGVVAASTGEDRSFAFGTNCGTLTADFGGRGGVTTFNTAISGNSGPGIFSNGPRSLNRASGDQINDNYFGFRTLGGGTITSFGDNRVIGNFVDGTPTNTATPTARERTASRARHRRHHRARHHTRHRARHHARHRARHHARRR